MPDPLIRARLGATSRNRPLFRPIQPQLASTTTSPFSIGTGSCVTAALGALRRLRTDSITVAPIQTLTDKEYQIMRDQSFAVIRAVGVETSGSNIQFAVNPDNGRTFIIEMNPRVSRSSALAFKTAGFQILKLAVSRLRFLQAVELRWTRSRVGDDIQSIDDRRCR